MDVTHRGITKYWRRLEHRSTPPGRTARKFHELSIRHTWKDLIVKGILAQQMTGSSGQLLDRSYIFNQNYKQEHLSDLTLSCGQEVQSKCCIRELPVPKVHHVLTQCLSILLLSMRLEMLRVEVPCTDPAICVLGTLVVVPHAQPCHHHRLTKVYV